MKLYIKVTYLKTHVTFIKFNKYIIYEGIS